MTLQPQSESKPYTFAVVSGKGGVGKTNIAANLSIIFTQYGKRTLLIDADFGLANVDVLFGLSPKITMSQVLAGTHTLADALLEGPGGITILPASSGLSDMAQIPDDRMTWLCQQIQEVSKNYDIIVLDLAAGIAPNMQQITALANEVLLLTTPEPTAVMDAYAVTKVLTKRCPELPLRLVVNMISEHDTGERVSTGFSEVVGRFLNRTVELLAQLPLDPHVPLAVRRQRPFALHFPECQASRALRLVALRLLGTCTSIPAGRGPSSSANSPVLPAAGNRISPWLEEKAE